MQNLPVWIPYPRCWVNAIALILLMIGLQYALIPLWDILLLIIKYWYNVLYLFYLLSIVITISTVTFLHHWLHRFLDSFFPETRIPATDGEPGFFPNLFSWWQGLYGFLVNNLSTSIVICLIGIFLPKPDIPDAFNLLALTKFEIDTLTIIQIILQVIVAAYLYQIEYLVHQRLMAAGRE